MHHPPTFAYLYCIKILVINESISHTAVEERSPVPIFVLIIWSWLLVGTLDILVAIMQTLMYGGKPVKMLQFIASGIFGKQAFSGGLRFAFYGLALHYCIALIWTVIFFSARQRFKILTGNKILVGIGYGVFIWLVMNFIVLPLSNTQPLRIQFPKAFISVFILVVFIGLPLSFIAGRNFNNSTVKSNKK